MTKLYKLFIFILISPFIFSQVANDGKTSTDDIIIKGEVIARLDKNFDPEAVIRDLPENYGVEVDRLLSKPTDIWLFKFDTTEIDERSLAREFYSINGVVAAQINTKVELRNAPNDPQYGSQWQHQNIESEDAWQTTTGGTNAHGEDVVVCIIESANVMGHPDLVDNHWVNTEEIPGNGIDDDGNGYVDDYNGWNVSSNDDDIGTGNHGTGVAGMIGAKGNNGVGIAGANWDVKMMVVAGYGSPFTQANIVEAYTYPMEQRIIYNQTNGSSGAFVVATNASWGVDGGDPNDYPIWCDFYDDLGEVGILNCGATTNSNVDVDQVGDVPTGCSSDFMIGVTATDIDDVKTFAGYGVNSIDVAAPGDNIYTTDNFGSGYGNTNGTSFASPLTAGVIGLLYSIPCPDFMNFVKSNPEAAAEIVRDALYDGVDQTAQLQTMVATGGRINSKNSIDLLIAEACSACQAPSNFQIDDVDDHEVTVNFNVLPDADDYTIYYQEAGAGSWTSVTTVDTSYTFSGLTNCTDYEFYVESNCNGDVSSPSTTISASTTDCGNCLELAYCEPDVTNPGFAFDIHEPASQAGAITTFEETSGWGKPIDEDYIYGDLVLVDDGSANPDEGCDPLVNGGDINGNIAIAMRGGCIFVDKAMNAQNAGAIGLIIVNNEPGTIVMSGTGPNVNIPVVMITQAQGNALISELNAGEDVVALLGEQNEYIESFELDNQLNVSGDDGGYLPPSTNAIDLDINETYSFTMTPGFDGQPLEQYTRIWIDLNQDGQFTSNEIVYDQGGTSDGILTDNFTVPSSADVGSTRLRVQMAYQGFGADPLADGCDNFVSGEVEDYCVDIKPGGFCNMDITPILNDPACNGVEDGEIELQVSGGVPGYSYNWTNVSTTSNVATDLDEGTYTIVVTDNSGCDTTVEYSLNYTTSLSISGTSEDPACSQNQNGEIEVNATGGNNIDYSWDNGSTGATLTGLDEGTYTVTATADNGCSISETYNLTYSTNLDLNANVTDPACNAVQNGEIEVIVSGGNIVDYSWGSGASGSTLTGLDEGTYTVTATSDDGCSISETFNLTYSTDLSIDANKTHPTCSDSGDGLISVSASGGPGITYSWTNGPNGMEWTGLSDGVYEVVATDENGCSISESFELEAEPDAPIADFDADPNFLTVEFTNTSSNGNSYLWDFGDGTTSVTADPTHTYPEDGTYLVCLTVEGDCEEESTCKDVVVSRDVANLGDLDNEDLILVYPNPASDILNFKISTEEASYIEMIDPTGKLVGSFNIENELTEVNVQQFVNGIYIYSIKDENGVNIKTDRVSIVR